MRDHRQEVKDALNMMGELNNVIQDTHGNVSSCDENGEVYIKPSGMPYDKIKVTDVCRIVGGKHVKWTPELYKFINRKPSVDLIHHIAVYERLPNIKAVCHTHSPYATAYAYAGKAVRCLGTEQSDFFGSDICVAPYSDLSSWGEQATKYINLSTKALLLGRHGVLTFGNTPEEAVKLAVAVENCARKNYFAETLFSNNTGTQLEGLPSKEVEKWHDRYTKKYGQ